MNCGESMDVKKHLNRVKALHKHTEYTREQLKMIDFCISAVPGTDPSRVNVQSGEHSDRTAELAIKRAQLAEEYYTARLNECEAKCEIFTEIVNFAFDGGRVCDPLYISILGGKYLRFQTLKQIATESGVSYDWIKHSHGKALQSFEAFLIRQEEAAAS